MLLAFLEGQSKYDKVYNLSGICWIRQNINDLFCVPVKIRGEHEVPMSDLQTFQCQKFSQQVIFTPSQHHHSLACWRLLHEVQLNDPWESFVSVELKNKAPDELSLSIQEQNKNRICHTPIYVSHDSLMQVDKAQLWVRTEVRVAPCGHIMYRRTQLVTKMIYLYDFASHKTDMNLYFHLEDGWMKHLGKLHNIIVFFYHQIKYTVS